MKPSFIGKLILSSEFNAKCDKCGEFFKFTLNEDAYVYMPTGRIRVRCTHCGQEHDTSLKIEAVKEKE